MSDRIAILKESMKQAILAHRKAMEGLDCGANMAAVIRPEVATAARAINRVATELARLDPTFPMKWTPVPEGT